MAWQGYVDNSMLGLDQADEGRRHLDKGMIISAAGDSVWAATPGFKLHQEVEEEGEDGEKKTRKAEAKAITAALAGGPAADALWTNGLYIAGERYVVTKIEDRSIYARKGTSGVIIIKTNLAILIGYYAEPHIAGNAATTMERLADYMISVSY